MNPQPSFTNIAIAGPGLLGGSLAMALRRNPESPRVRVWGRRPEAVDAVREMKIADEASTDLAAVVTGADLVVLCVPVDAMGPLAASMCEHLAPGVVLTDVGSVKRPVIDAVTAALAGKAAFVGSHPMAGSEQAGLNAAKADLFDGATCLVTPVPENRNRDVDRVSAFWGSAGCVVRSMPPGRHDESVALISHLPHLIAATLIDLVACRDPEAFELCGNGFRDTTRVASGPAAMWAGIFRNNEPALRDCAEAMIEKLNDFVTLLDEGEEGAVEEFLGRAKQARDRLKRR